MENNIQAWFIGRFPNDERGEEINEHATFTGLKSNIPNVYEYIQLYDSTVREDIFAELAIRMNVEYEYIYNVWLNLNWKYENNSIRRY